METWWVPVQLWDGCHLQVLEAWNCTIWVENHKMKWFETEVIFMLWMHHLFHQLILLVTWSSSWRPLNLLPISYLPLDPMASFLIIHSITCPNILIKHQWPLIIQKVSEEPFSYSTSTLNHECVLKYILIIVFLS